MRPFDLQEAINGAELITRDGHSVRLICHDRKAGKFRGKLIGLVLGKKGYYERIIQYDEAGRQIDFCKELDLLLKD